MADAAWLVLADRVALETMADRGAILSATLSSGSDEAVDKLELPTVHEALERLSQALRDPQVTSADSDALVEAVLRRGK